MAVGLNKVLLIGNLTKDPQLHHLSNGTPKAELRLATSRTYTANGEKREDTCYVDVIAWSRTAENVERYLKKGSKIFVEGRLDYQEWTGQDGNRRSKHQVVADRIQFLDSRSSGPSGDGEGGHEDFAGAEDRFGGANGGGGSYRSNRGYPRSNGPTPAPNAPEGAPQAETGLARPAPSEGRPLTEAMGIAPDEDIPF